MVDDSFDGSRKRRDRSGIMAEILEIAMDGVLKTRIMYKANLSYFQLKKYRTILIEKALLLESIHKGKKSYLTTEKGRRFVDAFRQLETFLNDSDRIYAQI